VTHRSLARSKGQGQKVKVSRPLCSLPCRCVRRLQRRARERVGRGKLLLRCRLLGGARRPRGRSGGGISWSPPAYSSSVIKIVKLLSSYIVFKSCTLVSMQHVKLRHNLHKCLVFSKNTPLRMHQNQWRIQDLLTGESWGGPL